MLGSMKPNGEHIAKDAHNFGFRAKNYSAKQKRSTEASVLGFECNSELHWTQWEPGEECVRHFVIKNTGLETAEIVYKPPQSRFFSLPLPQPRKIPPGISWAIPVALCAPSNEPLFSEFEIFGRNGSFLVALRAQHHEASVRIPSVIDFPAAPVACAQNVAFTVENTGSLPVTVRWRLKKPFWISPSVLHIPVKSAATCTATFLPDAPCSYTGTLSCDVLTCKDQPLVCSEENNFADGFAEGSAFPARRVEGEAAVSSLRGASPAEAPWGGIGELSGVQVAQALSMSVRGVGKVPQLLVDGCTRAELDLGKIFPGESREATATLTNATGVPVAFQVRSFLRFRTHLSLPCLCLRQARGVAVFAPLSSAARGVAALSTESEALSSPFFRASVHRW